MSTVVKDLSAEISYRLDDKNFMHWISKTLAELSDADTLHLFARLRTLTTITTHLVVELARKCPYFLNKLTVAPYHQLASNLLLQNVAQCTLVRHLSLRQCDAIDGDEFGALGALRQLVHLDLSFTTVSDRSVGEICAGATKLQELFLVKTPIGDQGVQHAAQLPALLNLTLNQTQITDQVVAALLGRLPGSAPDANLHMARKLQSLKLHHCVTVTHLCDLCPLSELPELRFLSVQGTRLVGKPLRALRVAVKTMENVKQCPPLVGAYLLRIERRKRPDTVQDIPRVVRWLEHEEVIVNALCGIETDPVIVTQSAAVAVAAAPKASSAGHDERAEIDKENLFATSAAKTTSAAVAVVSATVDRDEANGGVDGASVANTATRVDDGQSRTGTDAHVDADNKNDDDMDLSSFFTLKPSVFRVIAPTPTANNASATTEERATSETNNEEATSAAAAAAAMEAVTAPTTAAPHRLGAPSGIVYAVAPPPSAETAAANGGEHGDESADDGIPAFTPSQTLRMAPPVELSTPTFDEFDFLAPMKAKVDRRVVPDSAVRALGGPSKSDKKRKRSSSSSNAASSDGDGNGNEHDDEEAESSRAQRKGVGGKKKKKKKAKASALVTAYAVWTSPKRSVGGRRGEVQEEKMRAIPLSVLKDAVPEHLPSGEYCTRRMVASNVDCIDLSYRGGARNIDWVNHVEDSLMSHVPSAFVFTDMSSTRCFLHATDETRAQFDAEFPDYQPATPSQMSVDASKNEKSGEVGEKSAEQANGVAAPRNEKKADAPAVADAQKDTAAVASTELKPAKEKAKENEEEEGKEKEEAVASERRRNAQQKERASTAGNVKSEAKRGEADKSSVGNEERSEVQSSISDVVINAVSRSPEAEAKAKAKVRAKVARSASQSASYERAASASASKEKRAHAHDDTTPNGDGADVGEPAKKRAKLDKAASVTATTSARKTSPKKKSESVPAHASSVSSAAVNVVASASEDECSQVLAAAPRSPSNAKLSLVLTPTGSPKYHEKAMDAGDRFVASMRAEAEAAANAYATCAQKSTLKRSAAKTDTSVKKRKKASVKRALHAERRRSSHGEPAPSSAMRASAQNARAEMEPSSGSDDDESGSGVDTRSASDPPKTTKKAKQRARAKVVEAAEAAPLKLSSSLTFNLAC